MAFDNAASSFFIVAITLFFSTYFTSGLRALFSTLSYILSLLSHTSAVALLPICLLGLFFVQRKTFLNDFHMYSSI